MQHPLGDGVVVDAVVFVQDRMVPIDSKFPLENFRRAREVEDEGEKRRARAAVRRATCASTSTRSPRSTSGPASGTCDFALMYVPAEAVYAEIAADGRRGGARGLRRRAGASSRSRRASSTRTSRRSRWACAGIELQENAREVHQNLAELARLWDRVGEPLEKLGAHLVNAQKQYERDLAGASTASPTRLETIAEKADARSRSSRRRRACRCCRPPDADPIERPRRAPPATRRVRLPAPSPSCRIRRFSRSPYEPQSHLRDRQAQVRPRAPARARRSTGWCPSMMEELLFDDILYGNRAREEHRRFQQVLGFVADEVLEIQDLLEEVLAGPRAARRDPGRPRQDARLGPGHGLPAAGPDGRAARRRPSSPGSRSRRPEIASAASELYCAAARSPTTSSSAIRSSSSATARSAARWRRRRGCASRSALGYVFSLHPRFASPEGGKFWFQEFSADYGKPSSYARMRPTLEGGDVLVLREDLLAIGYSERTEKTTIERLAESFKSRKSPIKRILVVAIPPARSYMHLDTVFTMISQDECLVYGPMILPDGAEEADVYECDLTKREITWTTEKDLLSALQGAEARPEADPLRRRAIRSPSGASSGPTAPTRSRWRRASSSSTTATRRTAAELARAGYTVVDEADLLLGREELELWKPARST